MEALPYSMVRKKMVEVMEKVCDNHDPVIITRQNSRSVVMISLEDFNAIEEVAYLLRNPANASHLRASIQQFEKGEYQERGLLDE